ncbi:MAG: NADH-quinone oxidoreductase subunit C [Gammaproteobacteria bacterium]
MTETSTLLSRLRDRFSGVLQQCDAALDEVTFVVAREDLSEVCLALRDEPAFEFSILVDLCGIDYLGYGQAEWNTTSVTGSGFDRAVDRTKPQSMPNDEPRFAVVYHLLSITNNQRLRLKVFLQEEDMAIDSVVHIWPHANWFEREAFDLFGILFKDHPDLRRILTDYGFVGHPFRKDFPLSGHVEVRYDAKEQRVIYEPVNIEPRVLVPKVIRDDNRYKTIASEEN